MKMMLNNVRLAFTQNLYQADGDEGKGKAFSCTGILDPSNPAIEQLRKAEEQVAKEKWGAKAEAILKQVRAANGGVIQSGDLKAQYDGFEGNFFVSTRRKEEDGRPTIINKARTPVRAGEPGAPYSGCYVNMQIDIWAQDNSYGKKINAQLLGVQFVRDGDSFGGGVAPASVDDFDDLSADEDGGEGLMD